MNSTWNRATGSIPYQIVFNRKPCYRRIPLAQRAFETVDVREIAADDDADDMLARIQAGEVNEREAPINQAEALFRERHEFPELIDAQYVRGETSSQTPAIGSSSQQPQDLDMADDEDDDKDMMRALRESELDELQRQRDRWAEAERNRELNMNMPPIDPAIAGPSSSTAVLRQPPNPAPNGGTDAEIADSEGDRMRRPRVFTRLLLEILQHHLLLLPKRISSPLLCSEWPSTKVLLPS